MAKFVIFAQFLLASHPAHDGFPVDTRPPAEGGDQGLNATSHDLFGIETRNKGGMTTTYGSQTAFDMAIIYL
jgi:hypothetical protein